MNKYNKSWIFHAFLFIMFIFFMQFDKTLASGFFPQNEYTINQNKSMIICPRGRNFSDFTWKLSNKNVSINNGVITGISPGHCHIEVKDKKNGNISKCNIKVTLPEHIKAIYSSPNQTIPNTKSTIYIVTDKQVQELKVNISGINYNKVLYPRKNKVLDNGYLWSVTAYFPSTGKYNIKAFEKFSNKWHSYENSCTNIMVFSLNDIKNSSLSERRASEECIKFIASCEGLSKTLIPDYKNTFSIGHGHLVYPFTPFYKEISSEEALSILIKDINNSNYGKNLNSFLINNKVKFTQNQFDALLSFTYNLGIGWLNNNNEIKNLILNCGNGKKTIKGTVNSSNGLNLRKSPNLSARKIGVLHDKETVEILNSNKFNNSWYLVKKTNGTTGYCYAEYLDISYTYNGVKDLNRIHKKDFIKYFSAYHHAGNKCISALLARRFQELDIFFNKKYSTFDYLYFKKSDFEIPACIKKSLKL